MMFARKTAEAVCKILFKDKISEHVPPPTALEDLLDKLRHEKHLPKRLELQLRTIQSHGNFGSHDQGDDSDEISADYVEPCVKSLDFVCKWLLEKYLLPDYRTIAVLPESKPPASPSIKALPDGTIRILLGIPPSASVEKIRLEFDKFTVGRTGNWQKLWKEFEAHLKRKKLVAIADEARTRAIIEKIRKIEL